MTFYTFTLDSLECPGCGLSLAGEGTVEISPGFMKGDLWSVTEGGRVVENPTDPPDEAGAISLDYIPRNITCAGCGSALAFSYHGEH
jgi:hypothetical protein